MCVRFFFTNAEIGPGTKQKIQTSNHGFINHAEPVWARACMCVCVCVRVYVRLPPTSFLLSHHLMESNMCKNPREMTQMALFGCCVAVWKLQPNATNHQSQNPGYMKENFIICIESLHVADGGDQNNVSDCSCTVQKPTCTLW